MLALTATANAVNAMKVGRPLTKYCENGNAALREMFNDPIDSDLEVKRLQRGIDDLIGVLALRAAWIGREPVETLSSFLDSLKEMLNLAFICARVTVGTEEKPIEILRAASSHSTKEMEQSLDDHLRGVPIDRPSRARHKFGDWEIPVFSTPLGIDGDRGVLVAGARRLRFPEQTESIVLQVAANQLALGMLQVLGLDAKRLIAAEVDLRVAERTRELAVANKELQLQAGLLQHLPVSAWTLKPDGTPDFVNQVWLEFSGQTLAFVRSHPEAWMTVVHPDDREAASKAFWYGVHSGRGFAIETRSLRARDGTYRWHLQQAVPLCDASGRVLTFVGTTTDIDDQKRTEEELQRKEAFLADGQRLSSTGTFSWRLGTGKVTFSEEACRIFELSSDGPVTLEQIRARIHPDDLAMLSEKVSSAQTNDESHDYEIRLRMLDGTIKYLHAVAHAVRSDENRVEYIGAIRDVTEQRLSQEALRKFRSELAHVVRVTSLGAMTASIAHEVNQPLTGIATNAGACLHSLTSDPPNIAGAREATQRTLRDGKRASEIIARLRSLFGKTQSTVECFDLNETAHEVIAFCSDELQRSRVIVREKYANDIPRITGDRIQLQQVILNLVRNGYDAMRAVDDRQRELIISTERDEGNLVRLAVRDTGIGIAPQEIDKLFEAFYTTKSDGMGIGLSLSRSIIERHNGRLWATPNVGPGATFSFCIPPVEDNSI